MIPKGAIISILMGVIGAGVVGFFFAQIANQVPAVVYVQGQSLSVIPDKINFRLGEPVNIKIINSGTVPLTFSDSSYGLKIVRLDGTLVYSPLAVQVVSVLEPKQEKTFVWSQTKSDGSKVYEGRYKIVSKTILDSVALEKSITINIFK